MVDATRPPHSGQLRAAISINYLVYYKDSKNFTFLSSLYNIYIIVCRQVKEIAKIFGKIDWFMYLCINVK